MAKQNKRSEKSYIMRTEEKKNRNESKLKQVLWLKLSYLPGLTLGLWLVELLLPWKRKKNESQENWIGNLQDGEKNNQRAFVFSWLYVKIHFMKEF